MTTPRIRNVLVDAEGNILEKVRPSPLPLDVPSKKLAAPSAPKLKIYKPEDLLKVVNTPKTRTKRSEQGPNGHWDFPEPLGHPYFGFIYLIKNFINGKMYIGKKQYLGTGKINKGQETNWKWYTSSCKELCEAIKQHGKESFGFFVLEQYRIRGSLGFAETWSLCQVEALANRDRWYNGLINKVSWPVKESVSTRHKERLTMLLEVMK
jgi:hypothetical protein